MNALNLGMQHASLIQFTHSLNIILIQFLALTNKTDFARKKSYSSLQSGLKIIF